MTTDLNANKSINILLVEDDEIDVELVRRGLKRYNIHNSFHHAVCGVDALEILRGENSKSKIPSPFLMLVDINMPIMNGIEFLQAVREDDTLKQSIAFILTTSAHDSDVTAAYNLNAAGYFLKDNIEELIEVINVYWQTNKFPELKKNISIL